MKKFFVTALVVLGVIVLIGGAIVAQVAMMVAPWVQSSGPRPSDAQMIAHWRANRAVFEQLAVMMEQDAGLQRLGNDWAEPENPASIGVPPARVALYRKLFRQAAILSARNYGPQIEFRYFTQGIYIRGSSKGFCYGAPPDYADKVDGDLDKARDALTGDARRDFNLQRHLEGDWWLQYEGT